MADQREFLRIAYAMLALFLMAVTAVHVLLLTAPVYVELSYACLAGIALTAFSLLGSARIHTYFPRLRWIFAALLILGAGLILLFPTTNIALKLVTVVVVLMWATFCAGILFRQLVLTLGIALLTLLLAVGFFKYDLFANDATTVAAVLLSGLFASLLSYLFEQRARVQFYRQQRLRSSVRKGRQLATVNIDHGLQVVKEVAIDLASVKRPDAVYETLLKHLKRICRYDLVAMGRVKNDRVVPVLMRLGNSDYSNEDTTKVLWHNHLTDKLQKHRIPLTGLAEMGLLPSEVIDGEISFGYRLDIPFFVHGKLDGVVSFLRHAPEFGETEAALAASVVFHGLYAHRNNRQRGSRKHLLEATGRFESTIGASEIKLLSVDAFMRKATLAFQQAQERDRPVSLLLIELDNQKQVAKRFGVQAYKHTFDQVTQLLIEKMSIGGIVGRYGKKSIAVQLPVALPEAKMLAEKLRIAIKRHPIRIENTTVNVTISVGVSARDDGVASDFVSLLRDADMGLFLARKSQGNTVRARH